MSTPSGRKRVLWDEENLTANEEYRKLHPVTMKIDEPKTPYCPESALDDDGESECFEESAEVPGSWSPDANAVARKAKLETPLVRNEAVCIANSSPAVEDAKSKVKARPKIAVDVPADVIATTEQQQHEAQFRHMRKAVYADEGAKFKALLSPNVDHDFEEEK